MAAVVSPSMPAFAAGDDDLLRVLNAVEDPELGIGIVDVGLIYRATWTESGIEVEFATTIPSCPHAASLRDQIEFRSPAKLPRIPLHRSAAGFRSAVELGPAERESASGTRLGSPF